MKVYFLPPKTPMLNPTEYFFNEIKGVIRSRSRKDKRSYYECLDETLRTYVHRSMPNYYKCIQPYIDLALKQKPFK